MTRAKQSLVFVLMTLLVFSALATVFYSRDEQENFKETRNHGVSVGDHGKGVVLAPHDSVQPLSVHQRRTLVNAGEWVRIGLLDGEASYENSGHSLSMSKDGHRIAIGAVSSSGNGGLSGTVRAFEFDGSTWRQMGIDIDGENAYDGFGESVAMSRDGNIFAAGAPGNDFGHVRALKFDGLTWRQMGAAIVGKGLSDFFGRSVSVSDNGQRIAIGTYTERVEVYKWDSGDSSWKQVGHAIHTDNPNSCFDEGLFLAGNGMRLAIGARGCNAQAGIVQVFKWHHSAWVQMGTDIVSEDHEDLFGNAVAMSFDGEKVVVGAKRKDSNRGQVRVFQWTGSLWEQMGDPINGEKPNDYAGWSVSMDSDGRQVLVGSPRHKENDGHAKVFEWNGSSWSQRGATIDGEVGKRGWFGAGSSMSGDGGVVAVGGLFLDSVDGMKESGSVRIYRFEQESTRPFPPDFENVVCAYVSCLGALIKDFGSPMTTLQDRKIKKYAHNSFAKMIVSERRINEDGNAVVSLDRLKQAMKWIKLVSIRGRNIGDDDAVTFADRLGNSGNACAIGFVESFIGSFLGDTSLSDEFLLSVPTTKLYEAREKNKSKEWKKSLIKLLQAIRMILNEMGEKYVPRCNK